MKKQNLLQLTLTILLLAAGTASWAAESSPPPSPIAWKILEYTLIAREMSLRDALTAFGTAQGFSVIFSKEVSGTLSGDFKKLPPLEFLNRVTTLHNLIWYYDGSAIYIYTGSENLNILLELKYMKAEDLRTMLRELNVEDARFPLKTTSNDQLIMVAGPPRYVQLVAELVAKADILSENRAYSEVETRIFPLQHTWADDVSLNSGNGGESGGNIKGIASILSDLMSVDSNTVPTKEVTEKDKEKDKKKEPATPEERRIQQITERLDREFKPIIKPENRLNAVIVRDVASRMPQYERLIAQLDVPQRLVEIAVTSLEMSKDNALDWQLSISAWANGNKVSGGAGQNPANLFDDENLVGKGLAGAISYIGNSVRVSASLTALRQKGKARAISRTSLLTMNNMSASFTDTQSYHVRVAGTEVATLQEVTAGTTLQVKPRIIKKASKDAPQRFWMTIGLTDGGFEAVTVDSMPVSRNSSVNTQASVNEGECILLAGYMRDIDEEDSWGVPYLRDIPFIGWLFGGKVHKKETIQRMFILTPYIVELDTKDLGRVQASRQRDIKYEEILEDDKLDDDSQRELRDLERENQSEARREKYDDRLKERKGEIKIEKDTRQLYRDENRRLSEEYLKERREILDEEREALEARRKDAKKQAPAKAQPQNTKNAGDAEKGKEPVKKPNRRPRFK